MSSSFINVKQFIKRYAPACYFILTFIISWSGAFILAAPKLFNRQGISKMDGLFMFPVMIIGPAATCIILTALTDGKTGLRNLASRMSKGKVSIGWYATVLFIPPCLIMLVLFFLRNFVSPSFTQNFFPIGLLFGIPAGFFEEIGWTGYAFPKMSLQQNKIKASIILGLLWGCWHLPVIDFLGSATPHGQYLLAFFLAFVALLTAMRVIIAWVYANTGSVLLAQIMHAVSTGCLVMFGPAKISPAQEALWYGVYAAILWIAVLIILLITNKKPERTKPG